MKVEPGFNLDDDVLAFQFAVAAREWLFRLPEPASAMAGRRGEGHGHGA
jgi:hypothetical protein